jgi:hypothetical protein
MCVSFSAFRLSQTIREMQLYGAGSWTCTKREESKLQAGEMKLLKAIVGKEQGRQN